MPGYFQRQMQLTSKQFGYVGSYSRDLLQVEEMRDRAFGEMMLRFTTSILSGRTVTEKQRASVKVPASGWQHLKKTADEWHAAWLQKPLSRYLLFWLPLDILTIVPRVYFIPWFLRRHPVKYAEIAAEVRFSRDTLYPGADISLPPSRFGAPVMYESVEIAPLTLNGDQWGLEDYGPARFLSRHELVSEILRAQDQANASWGSFDITPRTVFSVLEWLGEHGVSVDQLIPRG